MNNSRFPKALIEYHSRRRRRLGGRPLKRLLDGVQMETEQATFVMEYDEEENI
jgi:hypothetical protein